MKRFLVMILAVLALMPALAIDQEKRFEDPEMQARYERLISEVRCLQCQNQSIKDSNVSLAADLRIWFVISRVGWSCPRSRMVSWRSWPRYPFKLIL